MKFRSSRWTPIRFATGTLLRQGSSHRSSPMPSSPARVMAVDGLSAPDIRQRVVQGVGEQGSLSAARKAVTEFFTGPGGSSDCVGSRETGAHGATGRSGRYRAQRVEGQRWGSNPRTEIPVRCPDDAAAIFDSTVILEYIEETWP